MLALDGQGRHIGLQLPLVPLSRVIQKAAITPTNKKDDIFNLTENNDLELKRKKTFRKWLVNQFV